MVWKPQISTGEVADALHCRSTAAMLDAIRPWFHMLWGAFFLLPLALKRKSWIGTPIRRAQEPARFWLQGFFGLALIAMGVYEAWTKT